MRRLKIGVVCFIILFLTKIEYNETDPRQIIKISEANYLSGIILTYFSSLFRDLDSKIYRIKIDLVFGIMVM